MYQIQVYLLERFQKAFLAAKSRICDNELARFSTKAGATVAVVHDRIRSMSNRVFLRRMTDAADDDNGPLLSTTKLELD